MIRDCLRAGSRVPGGERGSPGRGVEPGFLEGWVNRARFGLAWDRVDLTASARLDAMGGMREVSWGTRFRVVFPILLFFAGVVLGGGCLAAPPFVEKELVCPGPHDVVGPFPAELAPGVTVGAGRIEGRFLVTNAGNARYAAPIVVPPGRAGIEPNLSITYDSSAGDGSLGMGFFLSGISAVTRCPRTMVRDGVIRGVRFDREDAFCLDGLRLIDVGPAEGGRELRTFPDGLVKVISREGDGFEARTKEGRVRRYSEVGGAWWVSREEDWDGIAGERETQYGCA